MPNQFFSPEGDLENYFVTEYWLIDQYIGDELLIWGLNSNAQLGTNDTNTRTTPTTTFSGATNWKQVSSGANHTTAIKTDGTLWAWGLNSSGQLGINDTNNRTTPVTTLSGGTNWKQVSSGANHTTAVKTDGTLWAWGNNSNGQLGTNDTNTKTTPVTTFVGGNNWRQVSDGTNYTAAVKTDGTLWTWGLNSSGQLGTNDTNNRTTPVTTFVGGTNWKQVSCGDSHILATKTDGTLWAWGNNSNGQLGVNDTNTRTTPVTTFTGGTNWKQVSCGSSFSVAIKTDGSLWTWGLNSNGQLGTNDTNTRTTPVTTFVGGLNWKQISCGTGFGAAIKTDGTLWTWGLNSNGQLGVNDTNTRTTPVITFIGTTNWKQVSCGSSHTSAVTSGISGEYSLS